MSTVEPDNREVPPPASTAAARSGIFSRRRSLKSPSEALQPEAAPPPPEPKKKKRRDGTLSAFSGFLSFLLVLCVAGGIGLVLMQRKMREPGPLPSDKVVYVAPGTEVPDIIALLEKEGVIDNTALLNIELLIEGARSKLKAGEYLFKQQASLREVLDTLVNGRQILHAITIPEGLTSQQIVDRLKESDVLVGEIKDIPPEGSLLPETYKVARGAGIRDLVRKMQDSETKLLERVWAQRSPDLPLRSPHELLTLASIVEKETGKADERPRVAAVFINRLKKRMRLQSDPTIVYGLVGGRGTLGRGILASEVQKWTPYNTYAIDGLPPGPIANPGRAALEAVANPSRTQELYFVADGTGGHVFSSTLDEHNRNVVRWRQIERDKGAATNVDRAQDAPAAAPAAPA
ncbi:MAG: endolytic transglycosylase MltG, partial [Rhodoblastus sp.]